MKTSTRGKSADVLYLSFDGMTDPLGRSQVLPYLTGLAERGHRIRIISLEKQAAYQRDAAAVDAICTKAGIEWRPLPYRHRPPILSGIVNLWAIGREAQRLHRERPADFTHCRADLPAIAGLKLKRKLGLPLLYDMRSFWADERVEGGQWDQSRWLYRRLFGYFKRHQRELLAEADEMVTLSEQGRAAVAAMNVRASELPVTVIPCCADFEHFRLATAVERAKARAELGLAEDAPLLVHVGSLGCNCLLEEMLDFFTVYRERHNAAQFLFIAPSGEPVVHEAAAGRGLAHAVHVRSASRDEVPYWLGAADLGIMFVRPVRSKAAASPTKLGEMLAVGLPIVANSCVGDVAEILRDTSTGIAIDRFDEAAYREAIGEVESLRATPQEVRNEGLRWFDLRRGIDLYDEIYRRLSARSRP